MKTIEHIKDYEPDFLHKLLTDMLLIRRVEEKAAQMYGLQKIGGFCHLYIGQEAVAVGSIATLDLAKDYVLTAYRDHGHALACGMDPNALMAELYGKQTGCSKGKGGSMHLFDADKHMLGGNGIVGGHVPVATGVAFKIKYQAEDGVPLKDRAGNQWSVGVTQVASFPAGSFESTPIVWQGRIYVGSRDGSFYCLGDPDYTAPTAPDSP